MKKFLLFCVLAAGVALLLLRAGLLPPLGSSGRDEYTSSYIYVLDRESGKPVYEKNADARAYPASLTKMMTTLVALEHIGDLSAAAPVDLDTYRKMVAANASMAGFHGRERVTYRDLLYGKILPSGGEAANSLAVNTAGSVGAFVALMNQKADELGLAGTHFTNPEGLHDKGQYTTAADMAKLLDRALENGHFRALLTKETFQTSPTADHPDGIRLQSTVLARLNGVDEPGFRILGGKSGTTYQAGECWATLAEKNGREYIAVVMGAPLKDIHHPDGAQVEDTLRLLESIR
ncbi:D-alanyl-D-alanine carboxypeptidase family protein [Bhargavaea ullalensis]|uniref:D-alanyl-D-alanine carboxypeptidase (Penicillin-binding protein 5/6) n=1 Tax=Bhargavaea ullalensis TaxID=1265685 RepID=A0ABV2G875_9BACL